jgi:hypothetical protein
MVVVRTRLMVAMNIQAWFCVRAHAVDVDTNMITLKDLCGHKRNRALHALHARALHALKACVVWSKPFLIVVMNTLAWFPKNMHV